MFDICHGRLDYLLNWPKMHCLTAKLFNRLVVNCNIISVCSKTPVFEKI